MSGVRGRRYMERKMDERVSSKIDSKNLRSVKDAVDTGVKEALERAHKANGHARDFHQRITKLAKKRRGVRISCLCF